MNTFSSLDAGSSDSYVLAEITAFACCAGGSVYVHFVAEQMRVALQVPTFRHAHLSGRRVANYPFPWYGVTKVGKCRGD